MGIGCSQTRSMLFKSTEGVVKQQVEAQNKATGVRRFTLCDWLGRVGYLPVALIF